MATFKLALAGVATVALFTAPAARALTTLEYTGNPYTLAEIPGYGTSIDVAITLDTMPSNFSGLEPVSDILSLTLTAVGSTASPLTLNNSNVSQDFIYFEDGQVSAWYITLSDAQLGGITTYTYYTGETVSPGAYAADGIENQNSQDYVDNTNANDPGTWTISSSGVPEPGGWALMLIGLGGVGASLRRRSPSGATT